MKTSAILGLIAVFSSALCFSAKAQEFVPEKIKTSSPNDTVPPLRLQFDNSKLQAVQTEDNQLGGFMRPLTSGLNPSAIKLPPALTYDPAFLPRIKKPRVHISGYGHDDFIHPERTVVFSTDATDRLSIYSANTIGVYRTLIFPNINYYNLNLGANYRFHSSLSGQGGIFYNSFLTDPLPVAGAYANFNYRAAGNLWFDGGASYRKTLGNRYNIDQQSLMIDLHSRYQVADDWFLNAYGGMPIYQSSGRPGMPMLPLMPQQYYGGTVEYWFQKEMGIEGGLIWMRDMFTGKMRPTPKIELKFGPRK